MSLRKLVCACLVAFATLFGAFQSAWAANPFVVRFRSVNWQSMHVHDPQEASTTRTVLTKIGCEVRQTQHGDHFDVAYRCPQWNTVQVTSDAAAHQWEGWLKDLGFETSHQH